MFLALAGSLVRAAEPVAFKQLRVGKAGVSLPAHWKRLGPEVPVWLHVHGAPAVVETNFAAIGAPGVLVNLTLPGLSRVYAEHFADARVLPELLRDVEAALRAESTDQSWRLGRLTVSSFSAGFGGVREVLRQPAAFERIAALVMADSLYCGYTANPADKQIDAELMSGFVRFAQAAADGRKRFVISHSRQLPEGYASTTETAEYLIQQVGGAREVQREEWPGGLQLRSHFTRGQLDIFGFDGDSADDHMRHLRSIGSLLERAAPAMRHKGAQSIEELRAQIDAHLNQPRFQRAAWGVTIASLDSGRTLYEHHGDRLLSPASNAKLYVGALALDALGSDYRIVTPILGATAPAADGTLRGDLIVSGRGDPSWNSGTPRRDFWKLFEPFVAAVRQAGVRRVTGDVVADATWFRMPPNGAGWTADDLNYYYGAEISAVTLEDNYVEFRIVPGGSAGEPCALELLQPHAGLVFDNRTATIARGGTRRLDVVRVIGENIVHVFGEAPLGAAPFVEEVSVPRPAQWFATALKEALQGAGIAVEGAARSLRWPEAASVTPAHVKLAEITSPPLREMIRALMKPSQNLQTDLIFAHLGEKARAADAPAWRTSEQLAVGVLRDFLRKHSLHADDVRFEEGSGLSRNNLTSANATVALLRFMAAHRSADDFTASLPLAGVDGTLRRRMKGTRAEGNVRAKTGTLRWANSLGGYVTSASGERLVFCVMLNRSVTPAGLNARDDVDAIAVMLAEFAGRSETGTQ